MSRDRVSPRVRSGIMSRIRSSGTRPELEVAGWLAEAGLFGHFVVNDRSLPGIPDFHFLGMERVLFVDGGFWHGHPSCFTFGKSGEYWDRKIRRNMERDAEVGEAFLSMGYLVMRVWDFDVMGNGKYETKKRVVGFANGK